MACFWSSSPFPDQLYSPMEDIIPKPLRVIKTQSNSKHEIRSVSRSSYPSIPCRSSSLRLDSRQVSSDSSTSTTPSPPPFSDNSEPIKIRKRSRAYTISSQDRDSEGQSVSYPRGSDEVPHPPSLLLSIPLTSPEDR